MNVKKRKQRQQEPAADEPYQLIPCSIDTVPAPQRGYRDSTGGPETPAPPSSTPHDGLRLSGPGIQGVVQCCGTGGFEAMELRRRCAAMNLAYREARKAKKK